MSRSELEIGLNIDGAKRSFMELRNQAKGLEKSSIKLFSKEEKDFLETQSKKLMDELRTRMDKNREAISKQVSEMKKLSKNSKDYADSERKVNDLLKERTKLLKANQEQTAFQDKTGIGQAMGGRMGGVLSKVPGLGRLGKLAGIGLPGLLGGGALAAGGFALSRVMGGVSTYKEGVGDRISMMGLGMGDADLQDRQRAADAGLNAQDMRRNRIQAGRILGSEGGSQENVLRRAEFERSFGLESGSQMNMAAQLRGGMGGQGANQAVMRLQGSVLAAGMEEAIGPYLETATTLLAEINENGMMNSEQMISALATLVKDGKNTPEQVAKAFSTLQSSIAGSTGEANAFFQQAFGSRGIGNNTIGGTRLAIEAGGLFGMDEETTKGRLGDTLTNTLGNLGVMSNFDQRSSAILAEMKAVSGLGPDQKIEDVKDDKQLTLLTRFANNIFGTKGLEGLINLKMLEDVQGKGPEEIESFRKKIEEQSKSPELKALDMINDSMAGQTQSTQKLAETIKDELGNKFVPAANKMVELLTSIDKTIMGVASFFGIRSPTEELNRQIEGRGTIDESTFREATAGSPEMQSYASSKAAEQYVSNRKRLQELEQKQGTLSPNSDEFHRNRVEMEDLNKRQSNIAEAAMSIPGFDPTLKMSKEDRDSMYKDNMSKVREQQALAEAMANPLKTVMNEFKQIMQVVTGGGNKEVVEAIRENTQAQRGKRSVINVTTGDGVRKSTTVPQD